ncbi:MAG: ABC transporter substrate-binding protein [Ilumatobacteraceae bacterium]|nr:ABC transporter substrate-binding protein [Ilumatobacteraceae bacterium]
MRARTKKGFGALVALTLVATACGGDDDTDSAPTPTDADSTADDTSDDGESGETDDTSDDGESSESDDTSDDTGTTDADGSGAGTCEGETGGVLTYGSPSQPAGLDPVLVPGAESTGITAVAQIYDTLMQWDSDSGTYMPRVAESLEPDADFINWTLTLREGIAFGNGDPLTADAVKASIERFNELSTGPFKSLTSKITAMEVIDDLTLVFTLNEAWSGFPFTLSLQPGMIVNTAVVDAAGESFALDPAGAGVGAYELDTFTSGEITTLTAKEDYWNGTPCIEELRFVPLPADQARLEAFENGEFDVVYLRDPIPLEASSEYPGFSRYVSASSALLFNSGVGAPSPANDVRVRQGLALAIDTEAVNERANEGLGDADGAVLGASSRFDLEVAATAPDVEAARALLDEAKADGWDGNLRLICDAGREEVALAIAAQAADAGVTIDVQVVPNFGPLVDAIIVNQDFDLACWGFNTADEQPWVSFNNSLSSDSPANYGGGVSPRADQAVDDLRVASTADEVTQALNEIQAEWNEIVPALILLSTADRVIHNEAVTGIQPSSNTMTFFADASIES